MEITIRQFIRSHYDDISWLDYDESETKAYLRFVSHSTLYLASCSKFKSNHISVYQIERSDDIK